MQHVLERPILKTIVLSWLICGLGAIYYCYEYFLRVMPSVMMPEIMGAYDLTGAQVGNLAGCYYHAYTPMQLAVGLLMDRYGPRRLLTLACCLSAMGACLFASGYSLAVAEAGRFLIGFGAAFAFVGALKLVTVWLPPHRFALASGLIMFLGTVGAIVGDILLRSLVDAVGWQQTIYISAAAGLVLAVFLWISVRDTNPDNIHTDMHHTVDFKAVLHGLWGSIKSSQIWLAGIVGFLLYLSLSAFAELWGIPYLEQARGLSKTDAATANSLIFLGFGLGSVFWGWLSDFIQKRCLPMIFGAIVSGVIACILLYAPNLSLTSLYTVLFAFGLFSGAQILIFVISRESSPAKFAATAIALTNMIVMIGGNIFQPVIGKLLDMNWTGTLVEGARVYSLSAYNLALCILPISIVVAIVFTLFIRETYGKVKS